jgi:hypothetical protein
MVAADLLDSVAPCKSVRGFPSVEISQVCCRLSGDDESRHYAALLFELVRLLSQAESQQKCHPEAGADIHEA